MTDVFDGMTVRIDRYTNRFHKPPFDIKQYDLSLIKGIFQPVPQDYVHFFPSKSNEQIVV